MGGKRLRGYLMMAHLLINATVKVVFYLLANGAKFNCINGNDSQRNNQIITANIKLLLNIAVNAQHHATMTDGNEADPVSAGCSALTTTTITNKPNHHALIDLYSISDAAFISHLIYSSLNTME